MPVTGEDVGSLLNLTDSRVENGEETTDVKQEHCCTIVSGNKVRVCYHLSRLVGKPTMRFPTRYYTNRPVQSQKRARSLKFRI